MTKSPVATGSESAGRGLRQAKSKIESKASVAGPPPGRIDRLVALADHCAAALTLAEGMDERFLAYLLAMAVEEAGLAMRQSGSDKTR